MAYENPGDIYNGYRWTGEYGVCLALQFWKDSPDDLMANVHVPVKAGGGAQATELIKREIEKNGPIRSMRIEIAQTLEAA